LLARTKKETKRRKRIRKPPAVPRVQAMKAMHRKPEKAAGKKKKEVTKDSTLKNMKKCLLGSLDRIGSLLP